MSQDADELIGKQLVFVLAQKPRALNADVKIATLLPLMNLESGKPITGGDSVFPSDGYVRWYRVPLGEWHDGDLVFGELKRNEHKGYGVAGQEWFQVYGEGGERSNGRIVELLQIDVISSDLRKAIRRPVSLNRWPSGDFYLCCTDAVVGPFKCKSEHGRTNISLIEAADTVDGRVDVFARVQFEKASISLTRADVRLSSSDSHPAHSHTGIYRSKIQLFRKQDLDSARLESKSQFMLSDDLLVTKVCKQLRLGKKWTTLRDELKPLVNLLAENPPEVSKAVVDGLPKLLNDAELQIEVTEKIANAILSDERFDKKVSEGVTARIDAKARERADEIESEAERLAAGKYEELAAVSNEVDSLREEKTRLVADLENLKESRVESELRLEEIVSGASRRLETGRNQLLGEIALLAPLFQAGPYWHHNGNGHLTREMPTITASPASSSSKDVPDEPIPLQSSALDEGAVISKRLLPCLLSCGCELDERDAEFFHAAMVACRLIGVPHPGWAAGYAEAMGENANFQTITVSPDWLSFDWAFKGQLARTWRKAIDHPSQLFLIVFEGLDRCPSHAWFRPWLNIVAGWSTTLPDEQDCLWPENVRVCVTQEQSNECFAIRSDLFEWIMDFKPKNTPGETPELVSGHFPLDSWALKNVEEANDSFDGFLKDLEVPVGRPYSRFRRVLATRLRAVLRRIDDDRNDASCSMIIARRFFSCWSKENTK